MRLLLDTNVLIALVDARLDSIDKRMQEALTGAEADIYVSVASLWEIAIKVRLGKLALSITPDLLPGLIERMGLVLLAIDHRHVLTDVQPEPAMRDPFDRLLLAQCTVENLRLVTLDRALAAHPLAWRN